MLLTRFLQKFKGIFLGPSLTDAKCQVNICPGNICPGNICPYQVYLSCYRPKFDETSITDSNYHLTFVRATFVLATSVHIRNVSAVTDLI